MLWSGLAVQEADTEANSGEVTEADMAGCDQVVLTVGSLVSVFKMTNHKVCDKDGQLTETRTDGKKETDTAENSPAARACGACGVSGLSHLPVSRNVAEDPGWGRRLSQAF